MSISQSEVEFYHREGYLVPSYRLSSERLDRMRTSVDALIETYPHIPTEGLVSPHLQYLGTPRPDIHQAFLDYCANPELLDVVEGVIGPDIILWASRIFSKAARRGRATPWHQDGQYWPIRPLETVTAWIAVDASTTENGCLRVMPGSHRSKTLLRHRDLTGEGAALSQEIDDPAFDEARAVDVELEPGQMVLFDVYTAHGAAPNPSARRRAGFAIRYMPSSSLYDRSIRVGSGQDDVQTDLSQRALHLLRGADRHGDNDFWIGHEGMRVEVAQS